MTFGDSGELISASWRFGLAHPPGYPLYTTIAGLVLHGLPFGEPALRTNLLSALLAAAACAVIAVWAKDLWASTAAGAAAAGVFATSAVVWSTATETEVYALHALLSASFLYAAWSGRIVVASAALGLGLAHHPTIVLALPAALILLAPLRKTLRGGEIAKAAGIALAIPLLLDATLLLRGRHDAGAWGGVDSIGALVGHVTASRYRLYDLGWAGLARPAGWARLGASLAGGLAVSGLLAAIAGAFKAPRRERMALLVLLAAGSAFTLRYATEDVDVFLLPAILSLSVLAAGAASKRWGPAVAAVLVAVPLVVNARAGDRRGDVAARLYAEDMLATLPPGATLFVEGDDAFLLAYATQVLGERADLTVIDRKQNLFASSRFYASADPIAREIGYAASTERPVYFMSWPGYELPPASTFEPEGLFLRVVPRDASPPDDARLWARYHERAVVESAAARPGVFADAVAATYPLMRGEEALARGRMDDAVRAFDEAVARAPGSETVLNTIGTTWARRGDLARAEALFERAVRAKPQSLRAWLNLAQARGMLGDGPGAEAAASKARALADPGR